MAFGCRTDPIRRSESFGWDLRQQRHSACLSSMLVRRSPLLITAFLTPVVHEYRTRGVTDDLRRVVQM